MCERVCCLTCVSECLFPHVWASVLSHRAREQARVVSKSGKIRRSGACDYTVPYTF